MKKALATILALVMALGLTTMAWAEERVALSDLTEAEDGTYDANSAHVAYTYDDTKKCASSNDGIPNKWSWVKTVTITGINFRELTDSSDDMQRLHNVILNDRRADTSGQFEDSIEVKFVNCAFNQTSAHLQVYKIMPRYVTKYTFEKCVFNQQATGQYAVTLNVSETAFGNREISYVFDDCTINSEGRGINITSGTEREAIGDAEPKVVISGNTFNLPKTEASNMAIQIAGNWDDAHLTAAGSEMIIISNNNITAYAAIRVHHSMSANPTDSVKYLVKFDNNDLANVVTPVVADGDSVKVAQITETFNKLIVQTPEQPPRYYYNSTTTDTKVDETKGSPKTFDAGVGIYAVTAVLSVTGMAWVGKKRH
ncbi:MAG: hypothetical protein MR907_04135 [Firmicutes bacterium]|nr:hypothetical protein [Bacillota bacterium]